jgi:hypothetical protein
MKADSLSEGRRKDMAKRNNVVKRGDHGGAAYRFGQEEHHF